MLDDPDANLDSLVSEEVHEQYEELIAYLEKSKADHWAVGDRHTPLSLLQKVARLVMHMHGPYMTTSQAVALGLTICAASGPEEACRRSLALRECSPDNQEHFVKVGEWLLEHVSYLEPMLPLFEQRPLDLNLLGSFVDYHGRQARTADISTLKTNIHKWIPEVTLPNPSGNEAPPVKISPRHQGIFNSTRAEWGWNSAWSACLLIWRTHHDEFDRDPARFLQQLRDGKRKMNHKGFPSYICDETATGDPNDLVKGLFLGDLLKQVYCCVWTSPDSSTKEPGIPGAGRPSISQVNGINTVSPESITYIACLLRHILSSEASWNAQSPTVFDGATFFSRIVSAFNIPGLSKPVIDHFQYHVYGIIPGDGDSDGEDQPEALRTQLTGTDRGDIPNEDNAAAA